MIGKPLQPTKRQTLADQVYSQLLDAISRGTLAPGQKLVIDTLARDLGVSITPVREALMRLAREGLITETPFSATRVSELSPATLRELFSIRGVLEGYAVRLAAERLSDSDFAALRRTLLSLESAVEGGDSAAFRSLNTEFHQRILARAPGEHLAALIDQVSRNSERYRAMGVVLKRAYLDAAQQDHRHLLTLLQARQGDAAEALVRQHALLFTEHLVQQLAHPPTDHA